MKKAKRIVGLLLIGTSLFFTIVLLSEKIVQGEINSLDSEQDLYRDMKDREERAIDRHLGIPMLNHNNQTESESIVVRIDSTDLQRLTKKGWPDYLTVIAVMASVLLAGYAIYVTQKWSRLGSAPVVVFEDICRMKNGKMAARQFVVANKGKGPAFNITIKADVMQPTTFSPVDPSPEVEKVTLDERKKWLNEEITKVLGEGHSFTSGKYVPLDKTNSEKPRYYDEHLKYISAKIDYDDAAGNHYVTEIEGQKVVRWHKNKKRWWWICCGRGWRRRGGCEG